MTKIIVFGDVVARPGRKVLEVLLPQIKADYKPDLIVANGENAAGGFGITRKVFREFTEKHGIDCVTLGNHWADKHEIHDFYKQSPQIVLPGNMHNVQELRDGMTIVKAKNGASVAVINLIGSVFMKGKNRNFFEAVDELLELIPSGVKTVLLDFHAEATSEKQAIGQYLKDRVTLVYGTHTHCQTADERILGKGTGYISDVGMTGAYDSVIGIKSSGAIHWMKTGEKKSFDHAKGDPWACFLVVDVCDETGACQNIVRKKIALNSL